MQAMAESEAALDSMAAALAVQRQSLAAEGLLSPASAAANNEEAAISDDIENVLRLLKDMPRDDEDCSSKFGIFEGYLATVEKVRADTLSFWDEAKPEFVAGAREAIEASLKRLDSAASMGLSDDAFDGQATAWFVQPMARQASRNNGTLTAILASIRTKLELLNREVDCPICLERLEADGQPATTLPCCHKVCATCWDGWVQARGGAHGAFCPLCRHAEFLEFVLSSAPPQA